MKKILKSFITFTRTERIGIVCLCAALLVFITIRFSMPLWVHPQTDTLAEKKLTAEWENFKRHHTTANDNQDDYDTLPPEDTLYINTADSAALVNIDGIGPVTAHRILDWRAKNGFFTNIDQVKEATYFSEESFDELTDHVLILFQKI